MLSRLGGVTTQPITAVDALMAQCRAGVADGGLTFIQHRIYVPCFLDTL